MTKVEARNLSIMSAAFVLVCLGLALIVFDMKFAGAALSFLGTLVLLLGAVLTALNVRRNRRA